MIVLHENELPITDAMVRRLLAQNPAYAGLPLHELARTGSSNRLYRMGSDRLVRLPRQPGGTVTILKEARWSAYLAARLPVRIPSLEYVGQPDERYPESWSVTDWIEGSTPTSIDARTLADLVRALRSLEIPPDARQDATLHWYRAGPPSGIDDDIRECLLRCQQVPGLDIDVPRLTRIWERAAALPARSIESWVHADLLAENLLVDPDGRLIALLDLGAACIGDPAVDLIGAWELLDSLGRNRLRRELDIDDDEWLRGQGWAVAIAAMTFTYYWASMPARCNSRLRMVRELLADEEEKSS